MVIKTGDTRFLALGRFSLLFAVERKDEQEERLRVTFSRPTMTNEDFSGNEGARKKYLLAQFRAIVVFEFVMLAANDHPDSTSTCTLQSERHQSYKCAGTNITW